MYTYVCVCIYIYILTYIYIHMYICTHIYPHTYLHTKSTYKERFDYPDRLCLNVLGLVSVRRFIAASAKTHTHTQTHTHTHTHTHTRTHTYAHICKPTHTQTQRRFYLQPLTKRRAGVCLTRELVSAASLWEGLRGVWSKMTSINCLLSVAL